jgi:hypothetical protein
VDGDLTFAFLPDDNAVSEKKTKGEVTIHNNVSLTAVKLKEQAID